MTVSPRQAGAIPFRREADHLSFCLITTSDGAKWGFPKGIIERGDTPPTTALKEAREEAGLSGRIVGGPIGWFRQTKWGETFAVEVYLMEVERVDDIWDERTMRRRRWCDAGQALSLIRGRPVEPVFLEALEWLRVQ